MFLVKTVFAERIRGINRRVGQSLICHEFAFDLSFSLGLFLFSFIAIMTSSIFWVSSLVPELQNVEISCIMHYIFLLQSEIIGGLGLHL